MAHLLDVIDLMHEKGKFKQAVDSTSEQIIITDKDGNILYANRSAERITGFTIKEILGKKAGSKELWGGLMDKDFYSNMWKTIKIDRKKFEGELKNRRKNGEEYIAHVIVDPVFEYDSKEIEFFVSIERDVTSEREIEKSKTEFLSIASHQLRTPLSTINWYVEMLLDGDAGKLEGEPVQYLKEVQTASARMVTLVNDLLNVSRIEMGTISISPQVINLNSIVDEVITENSLLIDKKKLKIEKPKKQDNVHILADRQFIKIIVDNLVTNSIKYTKDKGNVEIRTKNIKFKLKGVEQPCLEITVKDDGYGIPKNQQSQIFLKLFRADNIRTLDTQGTGIGLYLVKSFVNKMLGEISFTSEEGVGTEFKVILPSNINYK